MISFIKKLLSVLTNEERRSFAILLVATICMGLFQAMSVVSIHPFMEVISNPGVINDNNWMNYIYDGLGFTSISSFVIFLGFATLGLLILSNIISSIAVWYKFKFVWGNNHSISRRLLDIYLRQPYSFFINKNSADVSKNILSEVQLLTQGYMTPITDVISGIIISIAILSMLLVVDPLATLFAVVIFGGLYGIMYLVFRSKLSSSGKKRLKANQKRFKSVNEVFGGIKDVKLKGNEKYYLDMYSGSSRSFADNMTKHHVIGEIPRFVLEAFAFGGIVALVLVFYITYGNAAQTIPITSVFAFAGYRLMPALQKIYNGLTKVRFNQAPIDNINHELNNAGNSDVEYDIDYDATDRLDFEREIELVDVSYTYPNNNITSLDNVNLTIQKGTSVAVVGPTGAGKTTLIDVILGLLVPQKGEIQVDSAKLSGSNIRAWQKNLGYVPQHIYLADDTVKNNIAFGLPEDMIDMDRVVNSAKIANIHDFITTDMQHGYETVVGERGVRLSGGQRQRIGIARALYHDPEVLVLDEATSSLDGMTEKAFVEALDEIAKVKTLVIIAHRFNTIKHCDWIYLLEHGNVTAQGTYDELMNSNVQFQVLADEG